MPAENNNTKTVLYLSYDGLTDPLGQSQIIPYLTGLGKAGFDITLITFEKKGRDHVVSQLHEKLLQAGISWIPLRYHKNPPVFSTIFDLLVLKRIIIKYQKIKSFSIVHCRSYLTSIMGDWHKRKFRSRFIFDMRGFWADERVEGGIWNIRNPVFRIIYSYFKRKERQFLQSADHIVVLTENAKNILNNFNTPDQPLKGLQQKITVIPTCVDTRLYDPVNISEIEKQKLRNSLGIKNDTTLLAYTGSLGTWYMMDEMLDYFNGFKLFLPGTTFLILTKDLRYLNKILNLKGFRKQEINILSDNRHGTTDQEVCFYSPAEGETLPPQIVATHTLYTSIPLYLSLASFSICFIRPTFSKSASSATKIAESLAMGLPVITNAGWGDVEKMSVENPDLYVVSELNEKNYQHHIHQLLESRSGTKKVRPPAIPDKLTLKSGVENYQAIYMNLLY